MRILVFGDSIAQGFVDEERGGWCNQLVVDSFRQRAIVGRERGRVVVNMSLANDTSVRLLNRIKTEVEARVTSKEDVVVLAIGVNDSRFEISSGNNDVSSNEYIKNMGKVVEQLATMVNRIIIIGLASVFEPLVQPIAWRPRQAYSNAEITRYNTALQQFAVDHNLLFIDLLDVYAGREEELLPDGIHPNAVGHSLIYNRVKAGLEKFDIL